MGQNRLIYQAAYFYPSHIPQQSVYNDSFGHKKHDNMSLQAIYNSIAGHYKTANQFGSISTSHHCAIDQIRRARLGDKPHYKILDLGVGDAAFLRTLRAYIPHADFTGIDISAEMLKHARESLPIHTIEASATDASKYLPNHSQDLVLAHFINAYVPIHKLFSQANLMTRASGHFSLITTTYDAFPKAQQQLADFVSQSSILSRIVGHYYKAIVKNTTVAASEAELLDTFAEHDFEIVEHQRLHIPIVIHNIEELARFGIEGTWFLNSLSIRMLPKPFIMQRLKRLFTKIFTFPYEDTHIIDVILAKK